MDELLELIEAIGTDDAPTDEELAEARQELVELLDAATEGDEVNLEEARALRQAIDAIDTEVEARTEAAEEEAAEAARLRDGVIEDDEDDEGDGEGAEGSGDGEGAEGAEGSDGEGEGDGEGAEAVAASLSSAIRSARARVQANSTPDVPANPHIRVRALGQAAGSELSSEATMAEVAQLFADHASAVTEGRQRLVRSEVRYPEDRNLGVKLEDNMRLINEVASPQAIAAAGGICDPLPADFEHILVGERGRPIRDGLPSFGADRGGVRYMPAASLGDFSGGITVWTESTDASPGAEEKACLVIDCDTELTAKVDAIVECAQIGNFQARFNSEQWRRALEGLSLAHDRTAEQTLYSQMTGDATAVTYASTGTIYGILSAIDKAVAGIRSRLRVPDARIRTVAPAWVRQALRADIASQRLGSSPSEALTVADQVIDSFFAARGVDPIWSPDLDVFGDQNAGALLDFPGAEVDILVYVEGDYLFLDGGTLDLGTEIVDSTLNKTNDRQAFMETFEKVILRGIQPLLIDGIAVDEVCVCPDVVEATS